MSKQKTTKADTKTAEKAAEKQKDEQKAAATHRKGIYRRTN